MRTTLITAALLLSLSLMNGASAQSTAPRDFSEIQKDIETVSARIDELVLWEEMQRLGDYIPNASRCADYYKWVREKFEELNELNAEYQGRADAAYRRRAEILTQEKDDAAREYTSCFASEAARSPLIRENDLTTRSAFKVRYDALKAEYGEGSILHHKRTVEEELYNLEMELVQARLWDDWDFPEDGVMHGGPVATVTSTFRNVWVRRGGGKNMVRLAKGAPLYASDVVVTGPQSRARVEIADRVDRLDVGPTIINIGPSSEVEMSHYEARREVPATMVSLLRGAIRAFTRNWGSGSAFSVRVGTSLCGIRGTDLSVSYNPELRQATYMLQHGTADLYDRHGTRRRMTPGTQVNADKGELSGDRSLEPEDYAQAILMTHPEPDLSESEALVMARERFGEASMLVKSQAVVTPARPLQSAFNPPSARAHLTGPAQDAHQAFEALQNLAAINDLRGVRDVSHGEFRERLDEAFAEFGAETVSQQGWRPTSWVVDCVTCYQNGKCQVLSRIEKDTVDGESGSTYVGVYTLDRFGDTYHVINESNYGSENDRKRYEEAAASCSWR
jgi:hypothetical protein